MMSVSGCDHTSQTVTAVVLGPDAGIAEFTAACEKAPRLGKILDRVTHAEPKPGVERTIGNAAQDLQRILNRNGAR